MVIVIFKAVWTLSKLPLHEFRLNECGQIKFVIAGYRYK
jgi:hypothetical protein